MGALVWVIVGLAIWHFTVFLPDRFWGGIVGAFVVALLINGFTIPGQSDTELITALDAVPGALIGIAAAYAEGVRRGHEALEL